MAGKRKSKPSRVTARTDGQLPPPLDFKGKPPMVCTLGEDLDESRRLQVALEVLKGRACWLNSDPQDVNQPLTF